MRVAVVDTGTANIASMLAALQRCGAEPELCREPEAVLDATAVVLPGVGTFAAGMERLRASRLALSIAERVRDARPLLAVCLGLQLLCRTSDESPGVAGVGVIDDNVQRFAEHVAGKRLIVPQLGWNAVVPGQGCRLLEPGYAYFANSYHLARIPEGWSGAVSHHGTSFVAALEQGALLACQFHPELSGPWGHHLLARWLRAAKGSPC
jgi:imidazole glycerol phosphate synthase glutamine amidotransferase subunit